VVATRRLAKPRPVQDEQAPLRGGPPRGRVVAKRDGHPRQNPAYRPATEKALETGLSLLGPIRRGLDTFPLATGERGGLLGTARPGRPAVRPRGCAGNAANRTRN